MQLASSPIFGDRIESFMDIFRSYTFICATAAKIQFQSARDEEFYTEAEVRRNIHIKDRQEKLHKPLEESEISPYMLDMLSEFRLSLKTSLEQNAAKLYFFLFQKDGRAIVDASDEGSFLVILYGQEHKWQLPLSIPTVKHPLK